MIGASPIRSRDRGKWLAAAAMTASLAAQSAAALDWHRPWAEPEDPEAAAERSDEFAWRLFVALNWPADPVARAADPAAALGADRPVVWESWRSAQEVFLGKAEDPGPWQQAGGSAPRRFEPVLAPDLRNVRHIVDGVMVPLVDPLASARRLTEIRMNRAAYDYIRARELYSVEGQIRAYSTAHGVAFPYGAIEVKAKWRPIDAADGARYHTLRVTLADGSTRLYGLTGLHIAAKDLPTWFWATFEQVDNPALPDNEGWQLPSRDRFACRREPADCNRAPRGIGLEGTVWQYYRLRGTLTRYTDAQGRPQRLANSELEEGMQRSASCITCHSRAALQVVDGDLRRLAIFDASPQEATATHGRRGFLGEPREEWFHPDAGRNAAPFRQLDFVWSLAKAQRKE